MIFKKLAVAAIAVLMLSGNADAQVIIEALDIRGTGIFGFGGGVSHLNNATNASLNGGGFESTFPNNGTGDPGSFPGGARTPNDPIDVQLTYINLDLDEDGTANDEVTFTMRWTKVDFDEDGLDGGALASFGQGMDTGFGNLNDMQVEMLSVSGNTTDSGAEIMFDGFTGANIGFGGNVGGIDRTVEVNGTLVSRLEPDTGGFQFFTELLDFDAPTPTVTFDNSSANSITPGNYNADGRVNAADYTVWRDNLGAADESSLNGAGDGANGVDNADYDLWVANFDQTQGVGSVVARSYDLQFSAMLPPGSLTGSAPVPEPSSVLLLLLGSLTAVWAERRR